MNTQNAQTIQTQAAILKTLADPIRLSIFHALSSCKEASVGEIIAATGVEQSHISHNLIKMKDRGVLQSRRDGKKIFYSLTDLVSLTHGAASLTLTLWPKTDA